MIGAMAPLWHSSNGSICPIINSHFRRQKQEGLFARAKASAGETRTCRRVQHNSGISVYELSDVDAIRSLMFDKRALGNR